MSRATICHCKIVPSKIVRAHLRPSAPITFAPISRPSRDHDLLEDENWRFNKSAGRALGPVPHLGSDLKTEKCHEMALEWVSGADFWCIRICAASPIYLRGFGGRSGRLGSSRPHSCRTHISAHQLYTPALAHPTDRQFFSKLQYLCTNFEPPLDQLGAILGPIFEPPLDQVWTDVGPCLDLLRTIFRPRCLVTPPPVLTQGGPYRLGTGFFP